MSRIEACFNALKNNNKKALIPFITAGDPSLNLTVELMHVLVDAGADIIELGVPFSDPMADGPVIQRASERALHNGTNTDDVFNIVKEFRGKNESTPVILMGYMNPIEVMGYEQFVEKAAGVGVDGLIIVDLPPEEAAELSAVLKPHGIDQIFLISPTTRGERLNRICEVASGFLYYVSLKGVTGSNQLDVKAVGDKLDEIRSKTSLPLGVGFGIKDAKIAQAVGTISDAVVVGSALVERIAEHGENSNKLKAEVSSFISSLRTALDNIE
jgi:tryptophan synthase alpha chain